MKYDECDELFFDYKVFMLQQEFFNRFNDLKLNKFEAGIYSEGWESFKEKHKKKAARAREVYNKLFISAHFQFIWRVEKQHLKNDIYPDYKSFIGRDREME